MASLSERSLTTLRVKTRLTPLARMRPVSISLTASDLDREAALVALDHPEPDRGHRRADDEHVEEQPRADGMALDEHAANPLDVRRDRVRVAHQVDHYRVVARPRKLVEAVQDRSEEEPGQEEDADQVLDVAKEDRRGRDEPADPERQAEEGEEHRDREHHRDTHGGHEDQRGRNEHAEHDERR